MLNNRKIVCRKIYRFLRETIKINFKMLHAWLIQIIKRNKHGMLLSYSCLYIQHCLFLLKFALKIAQLKDSSYSIALLMRVFSLILYLPFSWLQKDQIRHGRQIKLRWQRIILKGGSLLIYLQLYLSKFLKNLILQLKVHLIQKYSGLQEFQDYIGF